MLQSLALCYADFGVIRERNNKYIDKTQYIHKIVASPKMYFLSHPRRFGKSMTLRTLQELYKGRRELFEGLWIENHWDFTKIHPVIHISFKKVGYKLYGLENALSTAIFDIAKSLGIILEKTDSKGRFQELIYVLGQTRKVVVLIDEYDTPISDYLETNTDLAEINKDILKEFYTVLKENDNFVELAFITGVTKFAKVGIFSDLNNFSDISMHRDYATMLGFTQQELETNFDDYITVISEEMEMTKAELVEKMRFWYNGYRFNAKRETVYNPVSINSFFDAGEFQNFWFETGTPTVLINHLKAKGVYRFDLEAVPSEQFNSFDIKNINTYGLLFQSGYLTIKGTDKLGNYILGYPNYEVEKSMQSHLLTAFAGLEPHYGKSLASKVECAFEANDIPLVIDILQTVFKNIPYQLFINNQNEAFFHALTHLLFSYMGILIKSEVNISDGRCDALVTTQTHIYIIEFKLDQTPEIAVQQILDKNYAQAYQQQDKTVIGIGINFSNENKNISGYLMRNL
jgi:Predicted AAA-ATPase/PD-(D/E)XK nuclease superfamily